ncbi:FAD-dependent oxidoreductase [Halomonas sp. NCCP-2165]|nr:FAD-dependent oxidoreductase [Halomonas sp. NCCP-2165]GKW49394.1 hypothetical protein NCCP2165_16090 [Halomonas sp. NCCP-2165]
MPSIAIIGAGLAGLACARTLQEQGLDIPLFDKARGRVEDAWRSGHLLGRALAELTPASPIGGTQCPMP